MSKLYDELEPEEKAFHDALVSVVDRFGKFEEDGGVWIGYEPAVENEDSMIGVMCSNCAFYQGEGVCKLVKQTVEPMGICRLAAIPDSYVNMNNSVNKSDNTYTPTDSMASAARRALKYKEDGKAKGAGTMVGWTRARQLVNKDPLTLSTVKRMYSFFSRHEVDKQGKDWDNSSDPSNGRIMWLAWGGDAGFAWSRSIVEREKKKSDQPWAESPFSFKKG